MVTSTEGNSGLSTTATIGIALGCSIPAIALVIILQILVSQVFDSLKLLKTGLMIDTFKLRRGRLRGGNFLNTRTRVKQYHFGRQT